MKLFSFSFLLLFTTFAGIAQVTSVTEDFDISCATSTGPGYPTNWSGYCLFSPKSVLEWNCSPLGGRWGTPGFDCNSYVSGVHYADTAWLFTPKLDLSSNQFIYIRYDSKYEFYASKLSVLISHDYQMNTRPDSAGVDWTDITSTATPVIGPSDSLEWVTHYLDLTPYKATPLYVAFKYTSTNTYGGRWTIDNVMTTPFGMSVQNISKELMPITVLGSPTSYGINLSCTFPTAGSYELSICDLLGRKEYTEMLQMHSGTETISLSDLKLHTGMYFIKISNGTTYGIAKAVVE